MQRLPRLVLEKIAWRLPITDATASALLAAISRSRDCQTQLESTLIADPLLATWCTIRARAVDNVTFGTLHDLANWLNQDRLFGYLQWGDLSDSAPLKADAATLATWQRLADSTSRFLSASQGHAASDRAYYRRALTCGAKWFGTCCQRPEDLQDGLRLDRIVNLFADLGASVMATDLESTIASPSDDTCSSDAITGWSNTQLVAPLLPKLVSQLRRLADFEEDFDRQLEDQKLQAMKELAYGASHEINNPLANISARAQTLLVDERDPERRRKLAAINRQAFRAHDMIADMMLFAKPPRLTRQRVQVATIIDDVIRSLDDRLIDGHVRIECELDRPLPEIDADATQLTAALRAILQNAIQAVRQDGKITVSATADSVSPIQRAVTIRVQDSGPGIPEQTRLHIFDPFYSGREAGRGLGFGLSKAWRIVQEHGGRLDVENVPGSGTVFTMRVPSQAG